MIKNFISSQTGDEEAAAHYLAQARKYNPDAQAIDAKRVFEIHDESKKELRRLRHEISDREAIKISISLEKVGVLLSVVSTFFLLSGYLYNGFLLGHFGIEVSNYFTLSDYLASSIEGVRYSASAAALGLLSFFVGVHSASRWSYAQMAAERKKKDYWPYLILLGIAGAAIKFYVEGAEQFYLFVYLTILIFTLTVAPWISRHYFKEPIIALFVIVFVTSFSAHMYKSVGERIFKIEHGNIEELKHYEISFKGKLPFEPSRALLIVGNSNYLFMLNENKKIYVVPRQQINYVTLYGKPDMLRRSSVLTPNERK